MLYLLYHHPILPNECENVECNYGMDLLIQLVKKAWRHTTTFPHMCPMHVHIGAHTHTHTQMPTHTTGINPFLATMYHPSRYLLIKLVDWLSYCWTLHGSQLFVSLSRSNWLRLCYIQPFSHPVSLFPVKVMGGFALSQGQIRFSFPKKTLAS